MMKTYEKMKLEQEQQLGNVSPLVDDKNLKDKSKPKFDPVMAPRIYSLVPVYSWEAKYITLDTDSLYEILPKHITKKVDSSKKKVGMKQAQLWSLIFKIPKSLLKKEVGRKTFDFMINTDGVGASVHIHTWKEKDAGLEGCDADQRAMILKARNERDEIRFRESIRDTILANTYVRIMGIDPGRSSLMMVHERRSNSEFLVQEREIHATDHPNYVNGNGKTDYKTKEKFLRGGITKEFSNGRYYDESRLTYRKRKAEFYMSETPNNVLEWSLGLPTQGMGTESLKNRLRSILADDVHFLELLELKCSKKYVKLRWNVYISKKKTIYKFCKEILGDDPANTVLFFGNAKFKHNMRGGATSPRQDMFVKQMRRLKAKVVMVDEFRTSKLCSKCHEITEDFSRAENPYKVRQCASITCRMVWQRDVNAAINMWKVGLAIILNGDRPEAFRRKQKEGTETSSANNYAGRKK